MSKLCIRFSPLNGYDIPGLESWLEKQAAKGLVFAMTMGPLVLFERQEPAKLRFHLEPAPSKPDWTDPELNELYEQAGWKYLGLFRNSFAVFVTEDPEAQAHTDPETWDYALKRFLRRKLLGGVGLAILNFVLLNFSWSSQFTPEYIHYYWAEILSYGFLPWILTVLGLVLMDISYLHGLFVLWRLHRQTKSGLPMTPAPGSRLSGALAALSAIPLFLVAVEFAFLCATHGYFPYDLADSNFVTLTEIEGSGFQISQKWPDYMDYISHEYTPLTPESWFFRQYGVGHWNEDGTENRNVPHLEINITRYFLPNLAERRVWEWESWGRGGYRDLEPAYDLDQIRFCEDEHLDGTISYYLILRRGGTVLRVEYRGEQDITQFLPRFAEMIDSL
ncbi:DUF2812 domain-containing protein [Colidextribacter sp. OB.20]|uniref:DUF2812 domain-containing protein n=1 Tax=Colidextribacter sp. OB.20 TaxID=2304568 RepID=UPI00136DC130|nr:DUF2812 domain-containing protein [Colidextribacter sp. OB.20]NBI09459.1 DUF2812 domain-containing protein [Colidextribacter sp. OB.20]